MVLLKCIVLYLTIAPLLRNRQAAKHVELPWQPATVSCHYISCDITAYVNSVFNIFISKMYNPRGTLDPSSRHPMVPVGNTGVDFNSCQEVLAWYVSVFESEIKQLTAALILRNSMYSHWPVHGHVTQRFAKLHSGSGVGVWERLDEGWSGPSVGIAQGTKSSVTLYSPQTHTPYTSPFNSLSLSLCICLTLYLFFFSSVFLSCVFSLLYLKLFYCVTHADSAVPHLYCAFASAHRKGCWLANMPPDAQNKTLHKWNGFRGSLKIFLFSTPKSCQWGKIIFLLSSVRFSSVFH